MAGYRLPGGAPRTTRELQLLFESPLTAIGLFDARTEDAHFRCSGAPGEHLFVFPMTCVGIEHEGEEPFVADPNVVTFYNPDELYFRSRVGAYGDRGHWFALAPDLLEEILDAAGAPPARRTDGGLFAAHFAPSDRSTYVAQLGLARRMLTGEAVDALEAEETVLWLARRVVGGVERSSRQGGPLSAAQRRLAERARAELAGGYSRPEPLSALAGRLACSPYHLSRVFHRATGRTLFAYREQLRLRQAWIELPRRRGDLTGLALDLGYSSHSHFTAAFGRAFGLPPSRAATGAQPSRRE